MSVPSGDEPSQRPDEATAPAPEVDVHLRAAVREIEAHAAEAGWDQPSRLFALVPTADLLVREPHLAEALGLTEAEEGALTPVEQEHLPHGADFEAALEAIMWPAEVAGCAAVVERVVLPPAADQAIPDDPAEAEAYAAEHPDRQEVRMVVGVTRAGTTFCALRLRAHDDPLTVIESPDLVPGLIELLQATLDH